MIGDDEADEVLGALEPDTHVAAVRRILDRVLDHIAEDLAELALVGGHGRQLFVTRLQLDADVGR